MRRRDFMTLLGSAAAWPLAARAQPSIPVVGFLRSTTAASFVHLMAAVQQGLNDDGIAECRNAAIEPHWADNDPDRLRARTADLARRQVAVIVCNSLAAQEAKAATATIPIVFVAGDDPVESGLVGSL